MIDSRTDVPPRRSRPSAAPSGYLKLPRTKPTSVVFDRSTLLKQVGDDREFLRELVGIFLEDCPKWLEEIHVGVRRSDAAQVKLKSHLLAGTASSLGAAGVVEAARELELMGQKGLLCGAVEAYENLLVAVDELVPELTELMNEPV